MTPSTPPRLDNQITRRSFLTASALGALGAASISALLEASPNTGPSTKIRKPTTMKTNDSQQSLAKPDDVLAQINLTVAEGKRLIAEGIANDETVKARLASGMVIIARGTTNTYIAERLAGLTAPRGSLMTGHIIPEGAPRIDVERIAEIVLINGIPVPMPFEEALKKMAPGDIIFKGANLINYREGQAAVNIGAPDGGTTARLRVLTGEGKARLIVPVGLEKDCSWNLAALEATYNGKSATKGAVPQLWLHKEARIYTEIEALRTLAGVDAFPIAAGGIAGREGGTTLVVAGSMAQVEKALAATATVRGEKAFI
jgi:hypothetical protein